MKALLHRWSLVILCFAAGILPTCGLADSADSAKVGSIPVFNPAKTTVAILPLANLTGKQGKEDDVCLAGSGYLAQAFADRGFNLVAVDKVSSCLSDKHLDLVDEECRAKSKLTDVGQSVGADIVVCCVLQEVDSKMKTGLIMRKEGRAKVQIKISDVQKGEYLLNGVFESKKQGGWLAPGLSKAASLRGRAVMSAIDTSLEDFLKPYPVLPKTEKPK